MSESESSAFPASKNMGEGYFLGCVEAEMAPNMYLWRPF